MSEYKNWLDNYNPNVISLTDFFKDSMISEGVFYKVFENLDDLYFYLKEPDKFKLKEEENKQAIIDKAKELYKKHGKLTTKIMYKEGFPQREVSRVFGTFKNLTDTANIPLSRQGKSYYYTDEDYFANLVSLEDQFGYVNYTLIEKESIFTPTNYIRKFGTISEACLMAKVRHIGQSTVINPKSQSIQTIKKTGNILKDNYYHTEISFNWLRNNTSNRPMPVDAYFPYQNLIVEFHGPHHYDKDYFLYKKSYCPKTTFEEQQKYDLYKKEKLLDNGYRYVSIYDYEQDNLRNILHTRIKEPRF